MSTITATPAALAELIEAKAAAENELKKMRQINSAFRAGCHEFSRRGYSEVDYQKFADTIERNPEYGPVPFSSRLMLAKVSQIERLDKAIIAGQRFLGSSGFFGDGRARKTFSFPSHQSQFDLV